MNPKKQKSDGGPGLFVEVDVCCRGTTIHPYAQTTITSDRNSIRGGSYLSGHKGAAASGQDSTYSRRHGDDHVDSYSYAHSSANRYRMVGWAADKKTSADRDSDINPLAD